MAAADSTGALVIDVDHRLARHAVEDVSPDDALLLAIEAVLEAANDMHSDTPLTAFELALFDEDLLEPLIRRGQSQGFWSGVPSAAQLALSLSSLIAGLLPVSGRDRQEPWALARRIRTLFVEAAANAAGPEAPRRRASRYSSS
jgi:hypothetical protein